jgi:hypothetical protein
MKLDDILARASSSEFSKYTPGPVVAAVNALWPLGKDGALDAIDAYLATRDLDRDPQEGLFLVLRVLFDVDAPAHPPMLLGGSMPAPPERPEALPRFPIVIVDDLPLLLVTGYVLGGEAEPLSSHLEYYRANGKLRPAPLAPAKPAGTRQAQLETQYKNAYGRELSGSERDFIRAQLSSFE